MTEDQPETELSRLQKENRILSRKLARLESNTRQMEVAQRNNATLLGGLMRELDEERAKSRGLLLNILPAEIIDRLGAGETLIADRHEGVTVLFSDFVGFSRVAESVSASVLVSELGKLFSAFDSLCEHHGVEKIKTIGDAYMAVGGLPRSRPDHIAAIAETALGMLAAVEYHDGSSQLDWKIRIGIHTGPAVAGVIGSRKFAYDLWGHTVNVASRLEASCMPGRIHVSEAVAAALPERFELEPRGMIELKGLGAQPTSFLVPQA